MVSHKDEINLARSIYELPSEPFNLNKVFQVVNARSVLNRFDSKVTRQVENYTWVELLKRKKDNFLLFGNGGSGKKPIVYDMAYKIAEEDPECPRELLGYQFIKFDSIKFLALKDMKAKIQTLDLMKKYVNNHKVIIFLENFSRIAEIEDDNVYNTVVDFICNANTRFIMTLEIDEFNNLQNDNKIFKRFTSISVGETEVKDLMPTLAQKKRQLIFYHGVNISDSMLRKVILYSNTFSGGEISFSGVVELLDFSMTCARISGRKNVTEDDIQTQYLPLFEEFDKMSATYKKNTAIHEAGHYVVKRFCKHLKGLDISLVTIIPQGDMGGFNLLDFDNSKFENDSFKFYMEDIAFTLGGRAAEELFIGEISAGDAADLEQATNIARSMAAD